MGVARPQESWRLGYRPALDGFRGLAILLVMLSHARFPLSLGGGQTGVTMFFVLSGFLITSLLLLEHRDAGSISLPAFYVRRARRLLPALFVLIAAVGLLGLLTDQKASKLALDSAAAAFYVANWVLISIRDLDLLSHTWSLAIEEQFYLLWPPMLVLALALWGRARLLTIAGVLAGAATIPIALRVLLWTGEESRFRVAFGSDTRADAILLGCVVAILAVRGSLPRVSGGIAWGAAAALAVVALRPGGNDLLYPWGITVAALASAVVVAYLASAERTPLLTHPWLVWTGRVSYGLYLWHYPIMFGLRPVLAGVSIWVQLPLTFALSFAACWASWRLVEWPFLRGSRAGRLRVAARTT